MALSQDLTLSHVLLLQAHRKLLLLALVVTLHHVAGEETDYAKTTNGIITAGKKLFQTARQFDFLGDDDTRK